MTLFCPKCKSLMFPQEGVLICRACDFEQLAEDLKIESVKEKRREKETMILDKDLATVPKTKIECPKCGFREAYYQIRQMRAADEPPTRMYRCVKCKHSWRES